MEEAGGFCGRRGGGGPRAAACVFPDGDPAAPSAPHAPPTSEVFCPPPSAVPPVGPLRQLVRLVWALRRALAARGALCTHARGCVAHALVGGSWGAFLGLSIRGGIATLLALVRLRRNASAQRVLRLLVAPEVRNFVLFLGSYNLLVRSSMCSFRALRGVDDALNAAAGGAVGGLAMAFLRSREIALYVLMKAVECLYNAGVAHGAFPAFRNGDRALYVLSTSFLFWIWIYEPQNLSPGYHRFIMQVNGQRDILRGRVAEVFNSYDHAPRQ